VPNVADINAIIQQAVADQLAAQKRGPGRPRKDENNAEA
jgi:hypothetical protein